MVQATDDHDVLLNQQEDLPNAIHLLNEMNQSVQQVIDLVENMLVKVKNGQLSTEYGLSFLEVKYHMLLTYLINLTYVVLRKCSGERILNDPAIDRLIEIRTVLEKIRPIDYKLRYQIDKLVKTAITGSSDVTDPTAFKPNPNNLLSLTVEESSDEVSSDESETNVNNSSKKKSKSKSSVGVYVPPKHTAVHYDEDDTKAERNRKQLDRAKKRALSSSIVQDLKDEYLDVPTEVTYGSKAQQIFSRAQREKEEYEETYMTRLPITKAEKHKQKQLTTLGSLGDEITRFDDLNVFDDKLTQTGNKRKRKITSKKKRGGKKRKFV